MKGTKREVEGSQEKERKRERELNMFLKGEDFHVENFVIWQCFSVYSFTHLLLCKNFPQVSFWYHTFHLRFPFHYPHFFPEVLGTTRHIHITIYPLTLHLPIMMPEKREQFTVTRVLLDAIPTPCGCMWKCLPATPQIPESVPTPHTGIVTKGQMEKKKTVVFTGGS